MLQTKVIQFSILYNFCLKQNLCEMKIHGDFQLQEYDANSIKSILHL